MFQSQKLLVKVLLRENARLRQELRRKELTVNELLDRFVNNRVPERLGSEQRTLNNSDDLSYSSIYPSDAYSQAVAEAERLADATRPDLDPHDFTPELDD